MKQKGILGVDIGGSGVKAAIVDTKKGILLTERHRIATPSPATPEAVAKVMKEMAEHFSWKGPIGIGFPSVVQNGVVQTAANIDKKWIGVNAEQIFAESTGCNVHVLNDADAAGVAEIRFGAVRKHKGLVLLITVGSGIGVVLFARKRLVANLELGHIIMPNGIEAEAYASDKVRKDNDLSWEDWAKRFNEYLCYMESLIWPDVIVLGGGVSKKMDQFSKYFTCRTPIVAASFLNEAGLVGAAIAARRKFEE